MKYINTDNLRLEVLAPPLGLQNLILNPTGKYGTWGWTPTYATGRMAVNSGGLSGVCTVGGVLQFFSPYARVTVGNFVSAQFKLISVTAGCSVRANIIFYDTNRAQIGTATSTGAITAAGSTNFIAGAVVPANTVYARFVLNLYHSTTLTTNAVANDTVVFTNVMLTTNTVNTFGTVRTNLVTNPSIEVSVTNWDPTGTGSMILGRVTTDHLSGTACMQLTSSGGGTIGFTNTSRLTGIVGGKDYVFQFGVKSPGTARQWRITARWYTSANVLITAPTAVTSASTTAWTVKNLTATAPTNAAKVTYTVESTTNAPSSEVHLFDAIMLEQSSSVGTYFDGSSVLAGHTYAWTGTSGLSTSTDTLSSNYAYVDPYANWQNVLGPTTDISVNRAAFDVGTLTATIVDPDIDPAEPASPLDIGADIRLTAYVPTTATWENVFYGTIDDVRVSYQHDSTELKTFVTLEASDAFDYWSNQAMPSGVSTIDNLVGLMQSNYMNPYCVNGYMGQIATLSTANIIAVNADAMMTDQIALTRDSNLGYAWVDRNGVMQVWSSPPSAGAFGLNSAGALTGWNATGATLAYDITNNAMKITATGTTVTVTSPTTYVRGGGHLHILEIFAKAATTGRAFTLSGMWYDNRGNLLRTDTIGVGTDNNASFTILSGPDTVSPADATSVAFSFTYPSASTEIHYVSLVSAAYPLFTFTDASVFASDLDRETFSDADAGYNTEDLCNVVNLTYSTKKHANQQITLQTVNQDSVDRYGAHAKDWTAQGISASAAQTLANNILSQNAYPVRKINSVTFPVREDRSLYHAVVNDIYDRVWFDAFDGKFDGSQDYRITGIEHVISVRSTDTTEWITTYETATTGTLAPPKRVPQQRNMQGGIPQVFRYRSTNVAITTGPLTTVDFPTTLSPDFQITNDGTGNFTLPTTGTYLINASIAWDTTSAVGRRETNVVVNGTIMAKVSMAGATLTNQAQTISYIHSGVEGDVVAIRVSQNSGGNLNVLGTQTGTYLQIYRKGD